MRKALLTISGRSFDVDRFVARYRQKGATIFRKGERNHRGDPLPRSGCNVLVVNATSDAHLRRRLREFLKRHKVMLRRVETWGASAWIDVGVTVGDDQQFTASVLLEPDDLAQLASLKVGWCVSASPATFPVA